MTLRILITSLMLLLAGCDIPGLGPDPRIAKREADAKAIGGACRHGLRGIEDCYNANEASSKAAIFAGWKEMDQYMRENKIEGVLSSAGKEHKKEEIIEETSAKPGPKSKVPAEEKLKITPAK